MLDTRFLNLKNKAIKMVADCGIELPKRIIWKESSGFSTFGKCLGNLNSHSVVISINKNLVKDDQIINTMIHELLHSATHSKCGHKGEWLDLTKIIKKKYNIDITRCDNKELLPKERKCYKFKCSNCNAEIIRHKKPVWASSDLKTIYAHHSCGNGVTGRLVFVNIK